MADLAENEVNRRQFVAATAVATAAATVGLCALCAAETARADDSPTTGPSTIDAGTKDDYPVDTLSMRFVKSRHLVIVRDSGRIFAMTSICTHRQCDISVGNGLPVCNCHHTYFKADGTVVKGPARQPLVHYAIALDDSGHLQVDMTQKFGKDQWDDPKSFVTV